ncbi:PAS domain-containing hybrid sensor histidine kinase/response regulator [Chenggangzhangella methanolivorans]|uniref:histidine kinase n=1 Tax=Chenggangzhangella methanolivorans TaxID=1437009 RepID=A0A9E6REA2_9HYPH|nr:PAS domain-containing sensor histidine kinase [Chenggangzhangella methanolivorans]QZN99286.1 PAS domain S-box protein [Chenggangzhangella methanolivorans]
MSAQTEDFQARSAELEARLREALETIEAIRSGEVDAVVVGGASGEPLVYTLENADRPYRLLIEQMQEGALTLNREGLILYANRAFAGMLGLAPETVVGHTLGSFLSSPGLFHALFDRPGRVEAALRTANGTDVPVTVSFAAIEGDGEGLIGAVVTDLSQERRQAAQLGEAKATLARREGEGFSRLILQSATDFAIIATDLDERVTTWNAGAQKIFGWSEHEILGAPAPLIWTPEDRAAGVPELEMSKAARDGRAEDERWHLRRDGSRFWANGLMMPLLVGEEHIGYLKILRDRTESRLTEAALRDSEARLRFTLKAGRLGAWELDVRTGALQASETCRANFGRGPDDPFDYEDLRRSVLPDDRARMEEAVERSLSERVDYDIEYRVVWPSGEIRWVQIRGRPVYGEDGAPLRMTGVSLDITERRRAAEELERLNQTLESRVADEVARRGQAEDALRQSQKMEAVGQLTGGVAHDFNNLLTIVRSSVDFLRRDDLPPERRRRYIDAIADTVDRAAKLTGQLLSFARRQALKPEIFDVNLQVHSVADMLRTIVGARVGVVVEVDDRSPCLVEADVSQFETAVVNLAVNARDAMAGEGVLTIRVSSDEKGPLAARVSPGMVRIEIEDTGVGVAPEQLKQIFEPFFTTKEVGKGTGLGLSQAYGFAKQSGGDLTVRSALGQGATFTILLPHASGEEEPAARVRAESEIAGAGQGQWVLVVEDNNDVGAFSTQMLQDLGYNTVWANNAREALDLLRREPRRFDLVFSDIVMPGMGGVELGQEINRLYPGLPVLLTSGYSDVLVDQGRLGFELLQKPYAAEDLSRLVSRTVRDANNG